MIFFARCARCAKFSGPKAFLYSQTPGKPNFSVGTRRHVSPECRREFCRTNFGEFKLKLFLEAVQEAGLGWVVSLLFL